MLLQFMRYTAWGLLPEITVTLEPFILHLAVTMQPASTLKVLHQRTNVDALAVTLWLLSFDVFEE